MRGRRIRRVRVSIMSEINLNLVATTILFTEGTVQNGILLQDSRCTACAARRMLAELREWMRRS
jgi:hypothetical protein